MCCAQDDLKINFIPSDKYKLNRKDLAILKEDLERQVSQRVFEIQAGWDEREKLRHTAISRPPVIPPYPIPSPPVNIPLNGNNFGANISFDNPSYDGNLFDEHRIDENIENKISDFVEKKIQKDLSTQIAVTRQAINSLKKEISNMKPAKQVNLTNNIDNPGIEKNGNLAKDMNFVEKSVKTKTDKTELKNDSLNDADEIIKNLEKKIEIKDEKIAIQSTLDSRKSANTSSTIKVELPSKSITKQIVPKVIEETNKRSGEKVEKNIIKAEIKKNLENIETKENDKAQLSKVKDDNKSRFKETNNILNISNYKDVNVRFFNKAKRTRP